MLSSAFILGIIIRADQNVHVLRWPTLPVVKLILHMLPHGRHAGGDRVLCVTHGRLPLPLLAMPAGAALACWFANHCPLVIEVETRSIHCVPPQHAHHLLILHPARETVVRCVHHRHRSAIRHILLKGRLHRLRPHLAIIVQHHALVFVELWIPLGPFLGSRSFRRRVGLHRKKSRAAQQLQEEFIAHLPVVVVLPADHQHGNRLVGSIRQGSERTCKEYQRKQQ